MIPNVWPSRKGNTIGRVNRSVGASSMGKRWEVRIGEAQGTFWGWWNYSVWHCRRGCITLCLHQDSMNRTAQRVDLNACTLEKSFKRLQESQDGTQTVTRYSNCMQMCETSSPKGEEGGSWLVTLEMSAVCKTKAQGAAHKHCTRVEFFPQWHRLPTLILPHTDIRIQQFGKWTGMVGARVLTGGVGGSRLAGGGDRDQSWKHQ